MRFYLLLALVFGANFADKANYEGFKVYKVTPNSAQQVQFLNQWKNNEDFDFWNGIKKPGLSLSIKVAPKSQALFENYLKLVNVPFEILMSNVQRSLEKEEQLMKSATSKRGKISFTQYHSYEEIVAYLNELQSNYTTVVVESMGQSYEGKDVLMIKVYTSGGVKPVILVDGGIHSREWIGPSMVLYMIQELAENPDNYHMITDVDWIFVPVLNPDGYEFSRSDDRFWHKTRSLQQTCYGVDANRNFDFHWGEISSTECDVGYHGARAFSEIETRNLRDMIINRGRNIKLYISLHSFGQNILYPWSYSSEAPGNAEELQTLGENVATAIRNVNGTNYIVGSSGSVLNQTFGTSTDWVKGIVGVPLSYTIELPGGGSQGFDLPPSSIEPVVKETWPGMVVFFDYIQSNYVPLPIN